MHFGNCTPRNRGSRTVSWVLRHRISERAPLRVPLLVVGFVIAAGACGARSTDTTSVGDDAADDGGGRGDAGKRRPDGGNDRGDGGHSEDSGTSDGGGQRADLVIEGGSSQMRCPFATVCASLGNRGGTVALAGVSVAFSFDG